MMSKIMENYVETCKEAINLANDVQLNLPKPDNIVFTGMGGSGVSGNLTRDVVQDVIDVPIESVKGYNLPKYANTKTLVFCTSYSGNTEETLSQFVEAFKRKCFIISIGSGGKLIEWSKKLDIPFIQIPGGYQPRETIPYLFFSLLVCIEKIFQLDFSKDIEEFLQLVPTIDLTEINKIALGVKDSIPVIYSPSNFSGILRRIKSELNENSKMFAKFEELPELNHNEVVAFEIEKYDILMPIFVRDKDEDPEIKKRVEITKEIIIHKTNKFYEIWSYGNSKLAKALSLIYQGDYLSFKLAELRNVDWTQTKTIDKVKEGLKTLRVVEKLESEINSLV